MNINVEKNLVAEKDLCAYDKKEFARYKNDHYKGHRYLAIVEGNETHTILYFGFAQWRKVERRIQWLKEAYNENVTVQIVKF